MRRRDFFNSGGVYRGIYILYMDYHGAENKNGYRYLIKGDYEDGIWG